jgi:hypothetical protein
MPITSDTPLEIPATKKKVYDQLFIYNLVVHAPSASTGKIRIELLPFNATTGDLGPSANMLTLETNDLWKCVAEVPEVQQAFGAIIAAIPAVKTWVATQEELKNNPV